LVKAKAQIKIMLSTGNKRKKTNLLSKPAFAKIIEPSQSVNAIKKGNINKNNISIINALLFLYDWARAKKPIAKILAISLSLVRKLKPPKMDLIQLFYRSGQ